MKQYLFSIICVFTLAGVARGQDPYPQAPSPATPVVTGEYFFDQDPGFGNATPIALPAGTNINNFTISLALTGQALTPGFHWLYIRTRESDGRWSHAAMSFFDNAIIVPYPAAPVPATAIVAAEYFFDVDPGPGNGTPIPLPSATQIANHTALLSLSGVSPGQHSLYIRTKNSLGAWSLTNYTFFDNALLPPYPAAPPAAPALVDAEYFLDTDPGAGNGTPITIPASAEVSSFNFSIPLSGVEQGLHTVYIRSRQNPWSLNAYAEFVFGSILPVTWRFVKAEKKATDAWITWATASEENAASFEIEHSPNGRDFVKVGSIASTNNPDGSSYQFTHSRPAPGAAYYRIRQVDRDGKFTYSRTVVLLFNDNLQQPHVFPNPARDVIHVALQSSVRNPQISVIDMSGKIIRRVTGSQVQNNVVSIPLDGISRGQYILRIADGKSINAVPFTKE